MRKKRGVLDLFILFFAFCIIISGVNAQEEELPEEDVFADIGEVALEEEIQEETEETVEEEPQEEIEEEEETTETEPEPEPEPEPEEESNTEP